MTGGWHPWRALRRLRDVTLVIADLGGGVLGRTDFTSRTITLDHQLLQAERRSTLTHELVHLERGPVPAGYTVREERAVEVEAARRLITLEQLADAMLWAYDEHELADELWVDVPTVRTRLASLTDAEGRDLNRRLDAAELRIP